MSTKKVVYQKQNNEVKINFNASGQLPKTIHSENKKPEIIFMKDCPHNLQNLKSTVEFMKQSKPLIML